MKVIESLDEWYEALEADRLEFRTGDGEWIKSMAGESKGIGYVKEDVAKGIYRWAPEQIKLVEWRCGNTRVFLPEGTYPAEIPESLDSTGEVFLAEVITDGE